MIYFLEAKGYSKIKIGYTHDPERRMKAIAANSPVFLTLIKVVEGDRDTERQWHAAWIKHHIYGEWFRACPEMRDEIARARPASTIYRLGIIEPGNPVGITRLREDIEESWDKIPNKKRWGT